MLYINIFFLHHFIFFLLWRWVVKQLEGDEFDHALLREELHVVRVLLLLLGEGEDGAIQ